MDVVNMKMAMFGCHEFYFIFFFFLNKKNIVQN